MSKLTSTSRTAVAHDAVRTLLEPHREALVARLVELALAGDPRSIETALKHLSPGARPEGERVQVPGFASATTLEAKARSVIEAVADGSISAESGERLLKIIDTYQRSVVADEHERRLAALEAGKKPVAMVERVEPGPALEQRLAAIEQVGERPLVARVDDSFDDFDDDFSDLA